MRAQLAIRVRPVRVRAIRYPPPIFLVCEQYIRGAFVLGELSIQAMRVIRGFLGRVSTIRSLMFSLEDYITIGYFHARKTPMINYNHPSSFLIIFVPLRRIMRVFYEVINVRGDVAPTNFDVLCRFSGVLCNPIGLCQLHAYVERRFLTIQVNRTLAVFPTSIRGETNYVCPRLNPMYRYSALNERSTRLLVDIV